MTGIAPDNIMRRWAAKQLGISSDALPEAARAAFLRRLPEEEFVPGPALVDAARALGVIGVNNSRYSGAHLTAFREEENALRSEVEEFAGSYWKMPPDARSEQWTNLRNRARDLVSYRSLMRLRDLEGGLAVNGPELPSEGDPNTRELARRVCGLYVLRPIAQAREWQALSKVIRPRALDWKNAAKRLRAFHPKLAALQPQVVSELAGWQPPPQFAPPHRPKPLPADTGKALSPRGAKWMIWAVFIGASTMVRLFTGGGNYTTPPPTYRDLPSYKSPSSEYDDSTIDWKKTDRRSQVPDRRRTPVTMSWPPVIQDDDKPPPAPVIGAPSGKSP